MKTYTCPVCDATQFNLVYEYVTEEEYEGDILTITCAECHRGAIALPIDELALKQVAKYVIEEELEHELQKH